MKHLSAIAKRALSALLVTISPLSGGHPCASCHPKEVAGYEKTAMAHSLSRTSAQPGGSFTHALSGSEFHIRSDAKGMTQTLEREGVTGTFRAEYVIGSGSHAFGFLVNVNGYLFQSPISLYTKRRIWDMAPGYEADRNPDFTRPVTPECLWCHAGKPLPAANTLNRYQQPAFAAEAISCDRCHGAVEAHLQQPSATTIVNPKRLPARARDSVCEQCHLSGEARIPNPGQQIGNFRTGQALEDVFSVYVFEKTADSRLKVISHAEQLAQSVCRNKSGGRLWCGTCHNPHNKPTNVAAYYRAKCLECHDGVLKTHAAPVDNCVACHMPTKPARDGGHTAFTDHEIQRRPSPARASASRTQKLVAWQPPLPELAQRSLGLAYVAVGERDRSAAHLDEGYRLLSAARSTHGKDPALLTNLGLLALRQKRPTEAVELFEAALNAEPGYAPYMVNLATALKEAGRAPEAVAQLERALALDPSLEPAYRKLAEIAREMRQPAKLRETFDRYLKFMPESVTARIAVQSQ